MRNVLFSKTILIRRYFDGRLNSGIVILPTIPDVKIFKSSTTPGKFASRKYRCLSWPGNLQRKGSEIIFIVAVSYSRIYIYIRAVQSGDDQIGSRNRFCTSRRERCVSHPNRRISFPSYTRARCFPERGHQRRINGGPYNCCALRVLCADKLRQTRLRRRRRADVCVTVGKTRRLVCLFRGSANAAAEKGDRGTSVVGSWDIKPELYQQRILLSLRTAGRARPPRCDQ